jgi:hypothetical protein
MQEGPIVEEADPDAGPLAAGPGTARPGIAQGGRAAGTAQGGQAGADGGARTAGRSQGGRSRPGRAAGRHAAGPAPGAPDDQAVPAAFAPRGLAQPQRPGRLEYSAPSEDGTGKAERRAGSAGQGGAAGGRVGRNDLCPCGSGRKYKRCHGDPRNRQDA